MRNIAEIPHSECKISIFAWNQKYLIKLEQADLEQTFKVSEFDVMGDEGIKQMITEDFIQSALNRFAEMRRDLNKLVSS
jgi:hypothetical protein